MKELIEKQTKGDPQLRDALFVILAHFGKGAVQLLLDFIKGKSKAHDYDDGNDQTDGNHENRCGPKPNTEPPTGKEWACIGDTWTLIDIE